MKNFNISAIALAVNLAICISTSAMAESMSRNQYALQKKNIEAEYKLAKASCASFSGNAYDICLAEAKGNKNVAHAELKYNYKPSNKTLYGLRIAKADAEYSVATKKCDDKVENIKDVCLKEARAVQIQEITDAKVKAKTLKAKENEESVEENSKENDGGGYDESKPFKSNVIPVGEDIFKNQNKTIVM